MKYYYKFLLLIIFPAVLFVSCKKHEYYQQNPNNPSAGTPSLLLTDILVNTFDFTSSSPYYADRHLTYYERPDVYVNYTWGTSGFDDYDVLRQVKDMDEQAEKSGQQNYRGLAKFFRAVHFINLTETFGDVPYSEAMQALEGIPTPKYDLQKDIYKGVLSELEEANDLLDPSKGELTGDIIYGNSSQPIIQWKKLVNAYRLRILIHLSKKENDPELNIKQQFQSIIGNPGKYPLMEDISDNAQLIFNTSSADNAYPTYQSLSLQSSISMEKGFVNILKDRNDPRLFSFAEPISGEPENVFSSYNGVDAGLSVSAQQSTSAGASRIKKRYWNSQINEPLIFLSYAEQEFLIAEAISRNWVTGAGTAEEHYNNGITASMQFYDISDAAIASYLSQPNVAFNPANAISMIIVQKYIAFFMNSGWEAFYEQRRTGIPTLDVGPGTSNGGMVPKRWMYPQAEYTINKANVEEAVQRQYSGDDDINGVMWLLQ